MWTPGNRDVTCCSSSALVGAALTMICSIQVRSVSSTSGLLASRTRIGGTSINVRTWKEPTQNNETIAAKRILLTVVRIYALYYARQCSQLLFVFMCRTLQAACKHSHYPKCFTLSLTFDYICHLYTDSCL